MRPPDRAGTRVHHERLLNLTHRRTPDEQARFAGGDWEVVGCCAVAGMVRRGDG